MGAMNGGLPIETIKSLTRKYLQNLDDIDIEVYDFDTSVTDPLYNNLLLLKDSDISALSDKSDIQKRYWEKMMLLINQNKVNSLHELCNCKIDDKRVIGKTNIERLYHFLSDKELVNKLNHTDTIKGNKNNGKMF
jgi:hypothetical protein